MHSKTSPLSIQVATAFFIIEYNGYRIMLWILRGESDTFCQMMLAKGVVIVVVSCDRNRFFRSRLTVTTYDHEDRHLLSMWCVSV